MIDENTKGAKLFREVNQLISLLIEGDRRYIYVAVIFGLAVSLLTLAVPVSVQMLINSVAHTAQLTPVLILASILFFVLLVSGALNALQYYVMELFERRFYARITAQFSLRCVYADHNHFENINRSELVNRYFDIMNVQRIIPSLVIGFFSLILQMTVGILLVSFYHPWLLVFNICFLGLLVLIWRIWAYRAMRSAIDMSDAKYRTARHLEDVAMANSFFKSQYNINYAIEKTDALTENYLKKRIRYFRHSFSQNVALLFLYALASAGLLGVGGVLVVKMQLTLGQLVASELILSLVFFGVARLAYYWKQFYELSASLEEISRLYAVPLENVQETRLVAERPQPLMFNGATFKQEGTAGQDVVLNFEIGAGESVMVGMGAQSIQAAMLQAMKRYREPHQGSIMLGEFDVRDYAPQPLRSCIIILDLPTVIECTIRDYLQMGAPGLPHAEMIEILKKVELDAVVNALPQGLDTLLTVTGKPLTSSETLRLKLAAAWLAQPHVLVLSELFDVISYERRQRIFSHLTQDTDMTLLYFSNRLDLRMFDRYVFVDYEEQIFLDSVEQLRDYEERYCRELKRLKAEDES